MGPSFTFEAQLWLYAGEGAWYFVTLPKGISEDIKSLMPKTSRRGFGSVRVEVAVNSVTWRTSIFPDSKTGSFLLPVKKEVRTEANLSPESKAQFTLTLTNM